MTSSFSIIMMHYLCNKNIFLVNSNPKKNLKFGFSALYPVGHRAPEPRRPSRVPSPVAPMATCPLVLHGAEMMALMAPLHVPARGLYSHKETKPGVPNRQWQQQVMVMLKEGLPSALGVEPLHPGLRHKNLGLKVSSDSADT